MPYHHIGGNVEKTVYERVGVEVDLKWEGIRACSEASGRALITQRESCHQPFR